MSKFDVRILTAALCIALFALSFKFIAEATFTAIEAQLNMQYLQMEKIYEETDPDLFP